MIQRLEVEMVAGLARLILSEEEKDAYTQQLNNILDYVDKLDAYDTTDIEPTAQVLPLHNVLREDEVVESLKLEVALANAPEKKESFFKTPKIMGS